MTYPGVVREHLVSLGDRLLWGMQQYGVGSELFGSTAYVGFNSALDPKDDYFYCDGTADNVQINAAEAYVTALGGGSVELERGTYDIIDPIIPTGGAIWFKGQGSDTFLDGDGLATTEHVFHVTGRNDIMISEMSMQTQNGGGKTCHCIFIEHGSDRFHIHYVTIVDSDDDGIHIEGTTIVQGHIHDCHFAASDGDGILVDMAAGGSIVHLHILNCHMMDISGAGIFFDASNGNNYCIIEGNIIYSPSGVGIYVDDFNDGHIIGNMCVLGDLSGIHVVGSTGVNIADNICAVNERHGIFLTLSNNCLVDGNVCNDNDDHDTFTYDGINLDTSATDCVVTNNTCERNHNRGIAVRGPRNQVTDNRTVENDREGIWVNSIDNQINDNYVADNGQDADSTYHGIHLSTSAGNCQIVGNYVDGFGDSQEDGIYLETTVHECQIIGNHCYDGMGSGITLEDDNDYIQILGNYLSNNDDYGIEIITANSVSAMVKNNYFRLNGTAPALLNGTNIKLHEIVLPFVQGTTFLSDDTVASIGWEIDAATEFAATMGWIPNDVFQVTHLSIWGVSLVAEAGAMRLQIMLRAGLSNEAYNAEDVTLASHPSDTANFAAGDVIYWFVTPADDSDLGDLIGGDAFYVKVEHAAAGNGDCETDAVLYCATIGYV